MLLSYSIPILTILKKTRVCLVLLVQISVNDIYTRWYDCYGHFYNSLRVE